MLFNHGGMNMPRMVKKKSPPVKKSAKTKKAPVKAVKTAKKPIKAKAAKAKPVATKVAKPKATKSATATKSNKSTGPGIGASVPAFKLPATVVGEVSSETLKGKPFVLYFYPKDDTSGCTAQACGFRDAVPDFGKLGLTVIGVSKDGMKSHEKFAGKHGLTFPLASDEGSKVTEAFGAWVKKSMYGRSYMGIERSTFLVDSTGKVRAVWRKVNVPGHVDEVKKAVEGL
jgi:thioredoxin-dependent peroxiredoxin